MPIIESEFPDSAITRKIIGCAMKVHSTLGNGFQEVIYQRALELELKAQGVLHCQEYEMPIYYRNEQIGSRRVDFLVRIEFVWNLKHL